MVMAAAGKVRKHFGCDYHKTHEKNLDFRTAFATPWFIFGGLASEIETPENQDPIYTYPCITKLILFHPVF